jgi:hypothetical protein
LEILRGIRDALGHDLELHSWADSKILGIGKRRAHILQHHR